MGNIIKSTSLKVKHLLYLKRDKTSQTPNTNNDDGDKSKTHNISHRSSHRHTTIPTIITPNDEQSTAVNTHKKKNPNKKNEAIPSYRLLSSGMNHSSSQNNHNNNHNTTSTTTTNNNNNNSNNNGGGLQRQNSINPYYTGKIDDTTTAMTSVTTTAITTPTSYNLNQLPLLNINASFTSSLHSSQNSIVTN